MSTANLEKIAQGGWPSRESPFLSALRPAFGEKAVRFLFPARCVLCDVVLAPETGLLVCDPCRCILEPEEPLWQPCPDWPELDAFYSPFSYAGGIEHAIRQMKYNGLPRHAETLGFLLAEAIREMPSCPAFSGVMPVPMHIRKQRARGYNQAALLAECVGRELDIPVLGQFIGKCRPTRAQNGRDRAARLTAVTGSFAPYQGAVFPEPGTLLLVDDVATTGSTLCACAGAIREAWRGEGHPEGTMKIHAVTVAFA